MIGAAHIYKVAICFHCNPFEVPSFSYSVHLTRNVGLLSLN